MHSRQQQNQSEQTPPQGQQQRQQEPNLRDLQNSVDRLANVMSDFIQQQQQTGPSNRRLRRVSEAVREENANRRIIEELGDSDAEEERSSETVQYDNPLAATRGGRTHSDKSKRQSLLVAMAPRVIYFTGEENPRSWLDNFIRSMKKQDKQEDEFLDELPFWLQGNADYWFEQNKQSFKGKFQKFQQAFLERFLKDPDLYESQLLTTVQKPGQSLEEYYQTLQKIARPAGIKSSTLKIAFINGLKNPEMKRDAKQNYLLRNNKTDALTVKQALQIYEQDSRYISHQDKNQPQNNKLKVAGFKPKDFKDKKLHMAEGEVKSEDLDDLLIDETIKSSVDSNSEIEANQIEIKKAPKNKKKTRRKLVKDLIKDIFTKFIEKRAFIDNEEPIGLSYEPFLIAEKEVYQVELKRKLRNIIMQLQMNRKSRFFWRMYFRKKLKYEQQKQKGQEFTVNHLQGQIYHSQIYIRIRSELPVTNSRNKHLIIIFDQDYKVIMAGGIMEKTGYRICDWFEDNFFPQHTTPIVNTQFEKCFQGYFSDYLEDMGVEHNKHYIVNQTLDNKADTIQTLIPHNSEWDQYKVEEEDDRIQIYLYEQEQKVLICQTEETPRNLNPTVFQTEAEEQDSNEVNNTNGQGISSNLHKQLVQKVKNAKYIPAKSAKQFAENTLANMSLGSMLQNSPLIRQEWDAYIKECGGWYQEQQKKSDKQQQNKTDQQESAFTETLIVNSTIKRNSGFDYIPCSIYGNRGYGMLDTGANIAIVSQSFINKYNLQDKVNTNVKERIKLANGSSSSVEGIMRDALFSINGDFSIPITFYVTKATSYDVLISRNIHRKLKLDIFHDHAEYVNPKNNEKIKIDYVKHRNIVSIAEAQVKENFSVLFGEGAKEHFRLYPNFPIDRNYDVILIDAPWQYNTHTVPSLTPPYKTLTHEQLKMLPIAEIASTNAILCMWSTGPTLQQALDLVPTYDFRYRTILITYVKTDDEGNPYPGKGNYTQPCTELLLIATRGNIQNLLQKDRQVSQYVHAPIRKHSQKPKIIFEVLQKLIRINQTKNLEIFSREQQEYFDSYGNEIKNYFQPQIKRNDKIKNNLKQKNKPNVLTREEPTVSFIELEKEQEPCVLECNQIEEPSTNNKQKKSLLDRVVIKLK